MADYIVSDTSLTAVADAIRANTGKSGQMAFPNGFVSEIGEIRLPDWDGLVSGSWPTGEVTLSTTTTIPASKFQDFTGITNVIAPQLLSVQASVFKDSKIRSVSMPSLVSIFGDSFRYCYWFNGGYFPEVKTIGGGAFYNDSTECDEVIYVFPKVTSIGSDAFRQVRAKTVGAIIDFGEELSSLPTRCFYNSGKAIQTLILRNPTAVVTASNSNSIVSISSTETTVYVPQALVSQYEEATNWSTKGSIFQPIEGSIYETQYANGVLIDKEEAVITLPSEYQKCEYIGKVGKGGQYINTGVTCVADSLVVKTKHTIDATCDGYLLGARGSNSNNQFSFSGYYGGKAEFAYGDYFTISYPTTYTFGDIIEDETYYTPGSQMIYMNNVQSYTSTSASKMNIDVPFYIFGRNNNNAGLGSVLDSCKVYYIKIKKNGVLVRDYIPCYRISDGEIGLYDLVTETFSVNEGSGELIKGADIE